MAVTVHGSSVTPSRKDAGGDGMVVMEVERMDLPFTEPRFIDFRLRIKTITYPMPKFDFITKTHTSFDNSTYDPT